MDDKKINLPRLGFKFPRFWSFKIPLPGGVHMGGGKLILGSLSVVGIGFLASLFLLMSTGESEIIWPANGAVYEAPSKIGQVLTNAEPEEVAVPSQTLEIHAVGGTRLSEVNLSNISIGKTGLNTPSFEIKGLSQTDSILIDEIIFKNSEFPSFNIATSNIYKLVASTGVVCAGHTFSSVTDTSINDITIGSARGAADYTASDMTVDRIRILQTGAGATGDVLIGKVIVDGVRSWIGALDISNVEIGTLTFENVRVGDDGDINSSDCVMANTVKTVTVTDGIVEKPIFIR